MRSKPKLSSSSNLISNTGHRFISEAATCFKIHIHAPNDKTLNRSVGFKRIGKDKALKRAVTLRNELGKDLWKEHWKIILHDNELFSRLPHSLEPKLVRKKRTLVGGQVKYSQYYMAKWVVFHNDGSRSIKSELGNVDKLGEVAAYNKAKRALLKAYSKYLDILVFMGRVDISDATLPDAV